MNPPKPRNKVHTTIRVIHVDLDSPTATNASEGLFATSMIAPSEMQRNTARAARTMVNTSKER